MDRAALIDFLRDNLRVEVAAQRGAFGETDYVNVEVRLMLGDEMISMADTSFHAPERVNQ